MSQRIDPTEVREDQFGAWRNHPMSRFMFQYLNERADEMEQLALAQWRSGKLTLVTEQEMRGRVSEMRDIAAIDFKAIAGFYGLEIKEEEPKEEDTNGKPSTE